jgi:hypothetical protein
MEHTKRIDLIRRNGWGELVTEKTSFWNEEVDDLRKEAIKFFTEFSELEYFVWKNPDVEGIWVADDEYGYAILR